MNLTSDLRKLKKMAREGNHKATADYYRIRQEHVNSNAGIPLHFSREQRKEVWAKRDTALRAQGLGTHAE